MAPVATRKCQLDEPSVPRVWPRFHDNAPPKFPPFRDFFGRPAWGTALFSEVSYGAPLAPLL